MPLDDASSAAADDGLARSTALTAVGRSLLVQAGAGSGKTSVLAGRVVVLLAGGTHPSRIAAVSFTEFSASELRERIVRFVGCLLDGKVPPDLHPAFPGGTPTEEQLANLRQAQGALDCLASLTIHGFCQLLLTPYPAEAGIDPGAAMLDQADADLLFEDAHSAWLRQRLSGERRPDDTFAALYLAEPEAADAMLRKLAKAMREHRAASVRECGGVGAELEALRARVASFRTFVDADCAGCCPEEVRSAVDGLEAQLGEAAACGGAPEAESLPWMLRLRAPVACATDKGAFKSSRGVTAKAKFERAGKGCGSSAAAATRLSARATEHYEGCSGAHAALRSAAAGRALHILADAAKSCLERYAQAKLASAALDFGDLLEKTRLMLAGHPDVRRALGGRFAAVLVDEFQDTDPEQMEILWRLCGEAPEGRPDAPWREWKLRPGALFLVGDPKQSIYRFRGGDLSTYQAAKKLMEEADGECVLRIGRNFRSRGPILGWVNAAFARVFGAAGQAEFTELQTDVADLLDAPGVAVVPLDTEDLDADGIRDLEALEVAKLCLRLVGSARVRGEDGELRPCQARDIALLAPTGTDLWRYERALEDLGLPVAAQAGKGLFRRQEVQDLIALARVLADPRDRLALGALLRGPLVGLTDEVLLDTVAAQPPRADGRPPRLHLGMELDGNAHPVLRSTLERLRILARETRPRVTPHILLCKAVEELNARAVLRQRGGRTAERALSNLELFLEMARPYDVRGLKAFSDSMRKQWEDAQKAQDGRPDADMHSVSLVTMHSGKGLEWPVVIPVNTATQARTGADVAYDRANNHLHMAAFGCRAVGCEAALEQEEREIGFENQRLWYVATTRARDLLIMPKMSGKVAKNAWIRVVEFDFVGLEPFGAGFPDANIQADDGAENAQDRETFCREAGFIAGNTPRVKADVPHRTAGDESEAIVILADEVASSEAMPVRGSRDRGLILHKLLEEVLTRELADTDEALAERGAALAVQLGLEDETRPDPAEMARTVLRGLSLPEIAAVRTKLRPEWGVAASRSDGGVELIVSGVADAIAAEADGSVSVVVDWKSDIAPDETTVANYRAQLGKYLDATGAPEGLLVFLTPGVVSSVSKVP